MIPHFGLLPGARQIIHARIDIVKTSCGFSVPYYTYNGDRDTLHKWADHKSDDELAEYKRNKNFVSMDGMITPLGE